MQLVELVFCRRDTYNSVTCLPLNPEDLNSIPSTHVKSKVCNCITVDCHSELTSGMCAPTHRTQKQVSNLFLLCKLEMILLLSLPYGGMSDMNHHAWLECLNLDLCKHHEQRNVGLVEHRAQEASPISASGKSLATVVSGLEEAGERPYHPQNSHSLLSWEQCKTTDSLIGVCFERSLCCGWGGYFRQRVMVQIGVVAMRRVGMWPLRRLDRVTAFTHYRLGGKGI